MGKLVAGYRILSVAGLERSPALCLRDIRIVQELLAELDRDRPGAAPVRTQFIKLDELEAGCRIILADGARIVEKVDGAGPFLFRDRDLCQPEQRGNIICLYRRGVRSIVWFLR